MRKILVLVIAILVTVSPGIPQERANARDAAGAGVIRGAKADKAHKATARARQNASVTKTTKELKRGAEYFEPARRRSGIDFGDAAIAHATGRYVFECVGLCGGTGGWTATIQNVVTTVGKNYALDTYLAGSGFTVVGPYLGLISSTSYTAVAAADTMTSHTGWLEAGLANAPTYTGSRKTAVWSAASGGSKALSAALSFAITGTGTVKGCFLVLGTGALATVDNTAGVLYSAGTFTGGDKVVSNGDTLNVSYTASL